MVRLKDSKDVVYYLTVTPFQFQMVRLKVRPTSTIPHGIVVSIPNGSIKSVTEMAEGVQATMFQFQMVRLKAHWTKVRKSALSCFNSKWFD